jgi:hypothetical protein
MSRTKGIKAFSVVALAALLVFGLALSAYAFSGETEASGLFFTYYDVRSAAENGLGLTDNYYAVTSTSPDWVQAHVRVRTGDKSVELLDFDILLSPKDVFTFDLYEGASGAVTFASCDTKTLLNSGFTPNVGDCFVIDTDTQLSGGATMLSLIEHCEGESPTEALDHAKKGYVEVIVEGKVRPCADSGAGKYVCGDNYDTFDCAAGEFPLIPDAACTGLNQPAECCTGAGTGSCDAAKLLLSTDSDQSIDDHCNIWDPTPVLIGKQYYAVLSGGVAEQLAAVNAEGLNDYHQTIYHFESFEEEALSSNCSGFDDTRCFAYIDPDVTDPITNGADDLNDCFYTDTILVNNVQTGVRNKFGAAATFGPTLADLNYPTRNGSLAAAARNLSAASNGLGEIMTSDIDDVDDGFELVKEIAESHYFNAPAPIPVDLLTSFAVIFPLQHFIGESDKISVGPVFDLEENQKSTPITKFISPGLPAPPSLFQEASLFTPAYPFVEGWIQMTVSATNKTSNCTDNNFNTPLVNNDCAVCNDHEGTGQNGGNYLCTGSYTPGYTGLAVTHGANYITATPLHYDGPEEEE